MQEATGNSDDDTRFGKPKIIKAVQITVARMLLRVNGKEKQVFKMS